MTQETWSLVDRYFEDTLVHADNALDQAMMESEKAGLPTISVTPAQGKLLHILARLGGAKRILELGTLGGYSTIWLARALPAGGSLITLEIDPHHAEVARANIDRAGVGSAVEIVLGPAVDSLKGLEGPFDLIFIDADKQNIPTYFSESLRLARPGTLIVVDNVVRKGAVADPTNEDPNIVGVRQFVEMAAEDSRVTATTLQTVGSKGYDGLTFLYVK